MLNLSAAHLAKIDELEQLAKTRTDAMQIPRISGQWLAAMALAHQAKQIVEIGTSYGFSGLWWAAALTVTDGHLHTIDISPKKFAAAKETFAQAGLADRITSHLGDARELVSRIEGTIDLLFIDADKASSQHYFDMLWPRIRLGGSVVTDNIFSHQQEMAGFVAYLQQRPDTHSVTIPVGSGLEWTVKCP